MLSSALYRPDATHGDLGARSGCHCNVTEIKAVFFIYLLFCSFCLFRLFWLFRFGRRVSLLRLLVHAVFSTAGFLGELFLRLNHGVNGN